MTVATTKLSPSANTKGQDVKVDIFHLDQLPDAMEKMGWKVAPQLMRHWFSLRPAYKFTEDIKNQLLRGDARLIPEERVNDTIVKMAWRDHSLRINCRSEWQHGTRLQVSMNYVIN